MSHRPSLTTPAALGYRLPAEWEPHEATWLAWPHNRTDWPGKFAPIPWVYVEIVRHLAPVERVRILVQSLDAQKRASRMLARAGVDLARVDLLRIPTDRVWTRDYGPIFLKGPAGLAITDWKFNAWAKYPDYHRDNSVNRQLARRLKLPRHEPAVRPTNPVPVDRAPVSPRLAGGAPSTTRPRAHPVVLEGGSIDTDGQGTLLTTEECLLSPIQARNPGLTREDLERVFADYLAVGKVLWLRRGIAGDDTHGHIDDIARFVAPGTVVTAVEHNRSDPNYEPLHENLSLLRTMTDHAGRRLKVVTLPMPSPLYFDGRRLPASYANFYIANCLVLVPTFNDPHDGEALAILADLFPDRRVVGIHSVDLVWGLGTLHCMTQQQPA